MATPSSYPVEQDARPSLASGITGMFNAFVDPAATAKAAKAPLSWLWPLLILCVAVILLTMFTGPLSINIMRQNQAGMPQQQLDQTIHFMEMSAKFTPFIVPIFVVLISMALAGLVTLTASMLSMRTKFRDVFALMSLCSLISVLQVVATYFVLNAKKDDLASMQQLQPPFGLDIFFSELKGPLFAILNYFSLFQVWYLVIFGLALAYLAGSSKGKAFAAITPAWLIPLLFKIVGSIFQKG
ncbi:MAG: YIP1 family protein [Bryobacteraceae bacterium]